MPRIPVDNVRVTPHGKYRSIRRSPAEGSCGTVPYPCEHPGVDLAGPKGTPVYAPEGGVIVEVGRGDKKPWTGYGPGFARLVGRSKVSHLLAHLDPEVITRWGEPQLLSEPKLYPIIRPVQEGQLIGYIDNDHTHWETRVGDRPGKRTNPAAWWWDNSSDLPDDARQPFVDMMSSTINDPERGGGADSSLVWLFLLWAVTR